MKIEKVANISGSAKTVWGGFILFAVSALLFSYFLHNYMDKTALSYTVAAYNQSIDTYQQSIKRMAKHTDELAVKYNKSRLLNVKLGKTSKGTNELLAKIKVKDLKLVELDKQIASQNKKIASLEASIKVVGSIPIAKDNRVINSLDHDDSLSLVKEDIFDEKSSLQGLRDSIAKLELSCNTNISERPDSKECLKLAENQILVNKLERKIAFMEAKISFLNKRKG
ncbi:MAG: hypothetical protein HON32_10030 [Francisellaceae bacterium]|jgi:hypothetical protein|nr:hypothetical protein [Francisellaceae bacterium]MBT6537884.1 hypothetical protein [Francisellaceae bacterium]